MVFAVLHGGRAHTECITCPMPPLSFFYFKKINISQIADAAIIKYRRHLDAAGPATESQESHFSYKEKINLIKNIVSWSTEHHQNNIVIKRKMILTFTCIQVH